ncbi:hypothetical protein FHT46_000120 [Novosphingobium sp. BK258]|uniref:hypothetical protein n=1 Tax=Novosphingobium sp. BK369 TaxID=2587108 RepID=UPI001616CA8F|nr:hypothetical protein [Novosphingobium sp. BK369]MBB3377099.1 hypothetical protein [Novosphingobium sp. BK258]MBB3499971.1 hypothetical protein [Novosphingobium sp. BK336]
MYDNHMRERSWHLPVKIALPVLAGGFLADWFWAKDLKEAANHFPMRAITMLALVLIGSMFRHWRSKGKRKFR